MAVNIVTVKSRLTNVEEPIDCINWVSFQYNVERNQLRQITFTAEYIGSVSYALLIKNNIINYQGQDYVITERDENFINGYSTINIVATHIYTESRRIIKYESIDSKKTYSVRDVLKFYFDNNKFGFTYEVVGDFESHQIEGLGGDSAFEGLAKIVSTWSDAIIWHDNKRIIVYHRDKIVKNKGNQLAYLHNIDNIVISEDMSTIINAYKVIGAKDNDDKEYFPAHIVRDEESIENYGEYSGGNLEDDRFKDVNKMDQYAKTQMVLKPILSIQVEITDSSFMPEINELIHLSILEKGISTNIEVVGVLSYPFDPSQKTQVTLNSLKKTTIDYFNQLNNIQKHSEKTNNDVTNNIQKTLNNGLNWDWRGGNE